MAKSGVTFGYSSNQSKPMGFGMPDITQIKRDNPDLSIKMIENILKSRAEHASGDVHPYSEDIYKEVPNG